MMGGRVALTNVLDVAKEAELLCYAESLEKFEPETTGAGLVNGAILIKNVIQQ